MDLDRPTPIGPPGFELFKTSLDYTDGTKLDPFLGEMQCIAFRLMLSSCVFVCVYLCVCRICERQENGLR